MANVVNPRGFAPLNDQSGGPIPLHYYKANTSTNIYRGDIVEVAAGGTINTITATAGSSKIVGVAAHHIVAAADTSTQDIAIYDDPDTVFMAQDDGSATPNVNMVGATCQVVVTTGNTTTYQSKQSVKLSTIGTTATDALIIRGSLVIPSSDNALVNAMWVVQLNLHLYCKNSAGI